MREARKSGKWGREQAKWRSLYKSTSISQGVIKSLMKEVDWSLDPLLSCCLLLPVMSSNGIQLMAGEGKNVLGRSGLGCNGAKWACVCAWVDRGYQSRMVYGLRRLLWHKYTTCIKVALHSCQVGIRTMSKSRRRDSFKCHMRFWEGERPNGRQVIAQRWRREPG